MLHPLARDKPRVALSPAAGLHDAAFQLAEAAFVGTQLARALERAFASLAAACVQQQVRRGAAAAGAAGGGNASSTDAMLARAGSNDMDTGEGGGGASIACAAGEALAAGAAGAEGGAVADWRRLKSWLARWVVALWRSFQAEVHPVPAAVLSWPAGGGYPCAAPSAGRRPRSLQRESGSHACTRSLATAQARGWQLLLPSAACHPGRHPPHGASIHAAALAHGGAAGEPPGRALG